MLLSYDIHIKRHYLKIALGLMFSLIFTASSMASELKFTIEDIEGASLENAVITVTPLFEKPKLNKRVEIVDQIGKEYVPHVLIIARGSSVDFPNKDNIRHHVYSFSDAKQFELPLYESTAARPVVFEKAGVVALGCNIHDWMRGYIYVADTPYTALSDASGQAKIDNLTNGAYQIDVWHPRQKSEFEPIGYELNLEAANHIEFQLEIRAKIKKRKKRKGRYR